MTISANEWITSLAIVSSQGSLEIIERDPFCARLFGPKGPICLNTFYCTPVGTTVVDMIVPLGCAEPDQALDRWIARISPKLFNVHVAAKDSDDGTLIEARTTLVADGLTIECFDRALSLLVAGAMEVQNQLGSVRNDGSRGPTSIHRQPPEAPRTTSRSNSDSQGHLFAGYL